ncbi:MAG TPA: hypothetical protein VMW65_09755, partial [Chloroflexota bacterium]|nr:hypothetical protein [Chloroflexota bacterium]
SRLAPRPWIPGKMDAVREQTPIQTRILLKARPTPDQIADRFQAPVPEGLELYLDPQDLAQDDFIGRICRVLGSASPLDNTCWIVEAPIRTLGGAFFDLTRDDDDHRATLARVVSVGRAIGAVAANIHVVAPTLDATLLRQVNRSLAIEKALPLLRYYVTLCTGSSLIPQIENVPPVGRMRESAYVFSSIGAAPADLLALIDRVPELRFTVDVSHAGLYLNWRTTDLAALSREFQSVGRQAREQVGPVDLSEFVEQLAPWTTTVHVANASGLFGEGQRYHEGDSDLDRALTPLLGKVPYFVTETLESNPAVAAGMRDAQAQLLALRCRYGEVKGS